jgi:hypothetical protein
MDPKRPAAAVLGGVESASAGQLVLHDDCEVADEQGRGCGQLSNNNEIHGQSSNVSGGRSLRIDSCAWMTHLTFLTRNYGVNDQ